MLTRIKQIRTILLVHLRSFSITDQMIECINKLEDNLRLDHIDLNVHEHLYEAAQKNKAHSKKIAELIHLDRTLLMMQNNLIQNFASPSGLQQKLDKLYATVQRQFSQSDLKTPFSQTHKRQRDEKDIQATPVPDKSTSKTKKAKTKNFYDPIPFHPTENSRRTISEVKKAAHDDIWMFKQDKSENDTRWSSLAMDIELVSQEFSRLIHPFYPKTRMGSCENKAGIASKKLTDYQSLAQISSNEIYTALHTNKWHGMGASSVLALVLNNQDVKWGNLGLTSKNVVVNIDGNWCLADLLDSSFSKFNISENDIRELPNLGTHKAFNWLDQYKEGRPGKKFTKFPCTPECRYEINFTIFDIIILPDEFFHAFARYYASSEENAKIIANEMISNISQLREAALQNEAFKTYLSNLQPSQELFPYINHLKTFKMTGKNQISDLVPDLQTKIESRYNELKKRIIAEPSSQSSFSSSTQSSSSSSSFSMNTLFSSDSTKAMELSQHDNDVIMKPELKTNNYM